MLKTHLSGIKKIFKNSVWHHFYYQPHQQQQQQQQQRYQQQRAYGHQKTTTRQQQQRATLRIWKICCRRCLRKRRKFHDLTKIQNLWFGSNQNIIIPQLQQQQQQQQQQLKHLEQN